MELNSTVDTKITKWKPMPGLMTVGHNMGAKF